MSAFEDLVASLPERGRAWHGERLIEHTEANRPHIVNSTRALPERPGPCLIVSAGPSLVREGVLGRIHEAKFGGTLIATDGAYIQCLRAGIVPDYVVTLDPHPTRMVRWFGDPELEKNLNGDDYFSRQDLDVAFRENQAATNAENITLVDRHRAPLVIASTVAENVARRTDLHERYWFVPLVDDPANPEGLTHRMMLATSLPAMNTGGTVGTAAWVFAHSILKSENIAVVGFDYSYYDDLPLTQTQEWNMLKDEPNVGEFFPLLSTPWGMCRTSPTYWWYAHNLFDLLSANDAVITNCSEHGIIYGPNIKRRVLTDWLYETRRP